MLTCIHPDKNYVNQDANAYSTVLYLRYGDFTALFTGDLEGEGEGLLLERLEAVGIQNITLLKAAHHGSRNATSAEFLEVITPRAALLSAGRDNVYGHPHMETLERLGKTGCRIYQTPESGAVTVRVKGGKVFVEEYLDKFDGSFKFYAL